MKKILILSSLLVLTACGAGDPNAPKPQPVVKKTFEVDGCEVKFVEHPSLPNFYIARCGKTVTETWQHRSGKTTQTKATINVDSADELRNQLKAVEARDKALAKLSDEEKKLLGVK